MPPIYSNLGIKKKLLNKLDGKIWSSQVLGDDFASHWDNSNLFIDVVFIPQDVETEKAVSRLCGAMRQHRLDKKHIYTQAAIYAKPANEY